MNAPPRRVPVRYLLLLLDALQAQGVNTARILELAGLPAAQFSNREATVTSAEMDAFIATAAKVTGRDDLGFELGRRIKLNSHDLLGYGLLSCPNVDAYLRMACRHYHLMTETWTLRYRRKASLGECLHTPAVALPPESMRFYLEVFAVAQHNQFQLMMGADCPAYDYYLSMPEPAHVQRYFSLAPARFHFDEGGVPGLRVVMPGELLDYPLALADVQVMRQIDERCAALGQRPPRADAGWVEYVMMVLRGARGEKIALEDIARRVNVSARTIDRHLKKEGLGFRELSDKVRFERACELLCANGATIQEVALGLGFSDAPNFIRAFRRVMRVTPGEYQRSLVSARPR